MKRIFAALLFAALASQLCSPAFADETPVRPSQPLDARFVTSEAVAAVIVHPARIMASKPLERLPFAVLQAAAVQMPGIDLAQVEQLQFVIEIPAAGEAPVGLVIRFNRPQDVDRPLPGPAERFQWKRGELEGKTFFRNPHLDFFPGLLIIDEQTFLFGTEAMISRMVKERKLDSHLRTVLAETDDRHELAAYVSIATLRPVIGIGLQQIPIPPVAEPYRELLRTVSTLQLELSTQERIQGTLSTLSDTEEQAAKTEELLNEGAELAIDLLVAQLKESLRDEGELQEPYLSAVVAYIERMAGEVKKLKIARREGKRVNVTFLSRDEITPLDALVISGAMLPVVEGIQQHNHFMRFMRQNENLEDISEPSVETYEAENR